MKTSLDLLTQAIELLAGYKVLFAKEQLTEAYLLLEQSIEALIEQRKVLSNIYYTQFNK